MQERSLGEATLGLTSLEDLNSLWGLVLRGSSGNLPPVPQEPLGESWLLGQTSVEPPTGPTGFLSLRLPLAT